MSSLQFDPNEAVSAHGFESHSAPAARGQQQQQPAAAPTTRPAQPAHAPASGLKDGSRIQRGDQVTFSRRSDGLPVPVRNPQPAPNAQPAAAPAVHRQTATTPAQPRQAPMQARQSLAAQLMDDPQGFADEAEEMPKPDLTARRLPLTANNGSREVTPMHEDVFLPSEFVSYAWKDIQVRRFNVQEIRAIVRARTSGSMRHLIRALDATITRPVTDLTVGDFWYLMYWHRLNSYKKTPFTIHWHCDDEHHLQKIAGTNLEENEEAWDAKSLENLLTVNKSNLKTENVNVENWNRIAAQILEEYGVRVRPQSLVDFVAAIDEDEELAHARSLEQRRKSEAAAVGDVDLFLQFSERAEAVADEEDRSFMYRYAALLDTTHGASLQERVAFLDNQPPDLLVDLEEVLEVAEHGVTEDWTVVCKECGASKTIEQSLDAVRFLPSLQRGGLA